MSTPPVSFRTALVFTLLLLATLASPQGAAAAERLALRTNDAQGVPGGVVAVVVRTYASRAIGQGQITFRSAPLVKSLADKRGGSDDGGGEGESGGSGSGGNGGNGGNAGGGTGAAAATSPFVRLESFVVFSARQDARFTGAFDAQRAVLTFNSPTRSINAADGPLAIFYFRLSDTVRPGQVFEIGVEAAGTVLFDDKGRRVAIEARPGRLEIRPDTGTMPLAAESSVVRSGRMGVVGILTRDVVGLGSGRIGLRYDPKIARKSPFVVVDPRMGTLRYSVDATTPGLVLITFESPDASFNRIPGRLFDVHIPTSGSVRRGTVSPLSLDPSLTWLADAEGHVLPLELENGTLQFR
jgi:hypothetical protein